MSEGLVEHWLSRLEGMMRTSLYDNTKKSYFDYPENGLERKEWLFRYPA